MKELLTLTLLMSGFAAWCQTETIGVLPRDHAKVKDVRMQSYTSSKIVLPVGSIKFADIYAVYFEEMDKNKYDLYQYLWEADCQIYINGELLEPPKRSMPLKLDWNEGYPRFQKVIEIPGMTAADIYDFSIKWIARTYKNPEKVTSARIDNEMIRGEGYAESAIKIAALVYGDLRYTFTIDVKNNKARFTINDMNIITSSGTYSLESYVFKGDGSERSNFQAENVKEGASMNASGLIKSFESFLTSDHKVGKDDW